MRETTSIRFTDGLLGRTVLLGILPTAAVLAGVIVVGGVSRYTSLRQGAEAQLRNLASETALEFDQAADDAVELARTLAVAQSAGMFGMRRLTVEVLERQLAENPDALAVYVGYEPELYHLDDDPEELHDLATSPDHALVRAGMLARLRTVVEPEHADRAAKDDQNALVERHGGRDAALQVGKFGATPAPKVTP